MALFEWKDSLSVGISKIDDQHKRLIEMLNLVHEDVSKPSVQGKALQVLTELVSYTNTHFAEEERLMTKAGFPGLARHKLEHEEFAKKVRSLLGSCQGGTNALAMQLLSAMKHWLATHIERSDQEYARHIRGRAA